MMGSGASRTWWIYWNRNILSKVRWGSTLILDYSLYGMYSWYDSTGTTTGWLGTGGVPGTSTRYYRWERESFRLASEQCQSTRDSCVWWCHRNNNSDWMIFERFLRKRVNTSSNSLFNVRFFLLMSSPAAVMQQRYADICFNFIHNRWYFLHVIIYMIAN